MADTPTYDDLQRQLSDAIRQLEARSQIAAFGPGGSDDGGLLAQAMQATLTAFSASLGECRQDTPFSPLHPVIDHDGNFKWCCNHDPEHCAR